MSARRSKKIMYGRRRGGYVLVRPRWGEDLARVIFSFNATRIRTGRLSYLHVW